MADSTNLYIRVIALLQGMAKFKMFGSQLKLLKSTFRAVFRTTAVVAFFMIFRSASQAIHNTIEKIKSLVSESAKLQFTAQQTATVISSGGAKTAEYFKESIAMARKMSTETMFSAQKIQEGFFRAAMAGFEAKEGFEIVNKTLKMATIAGVDFRGSMSGVIGVTRAFEVSMKELPHMADAMTVAFTKANMTFTGLITAMKYVAPVSVAAFGSTSKTFIDTTSALMTLSNSGLDMSRSGVYLRGTMLKLMGATSKVTSAFAKYGINLYEGDGEAKKYMGTMIKGQKVMSELYDTVTRLKDAQYDLLLSGESGTEEYKKIVKELDEAQKKLTEYGSGVKYVQEQFRTAGGTLRPLSSILSEIQAKIPGAASVLTKIFGVRGGAGIATLLTKSKDFEKNVKLLSEVWKESEKGKSILKEIFVDILKTALVKWEQIKNTVFAIFNVIIESGLEEMTPVLDTVLDGLKDVLEEIENNKGVFGEIFKTVIDDYLPEIKKFFKTDLPNLIEKVNVFAPEWSTPLYKSRLNKETGKWEATKVEELTAETPGGRLLKLGESMASYFIASFISLLKNHKKDFLFMGGAIATGLKIMLEGMTKTFTNLGIAIADGMIQEMLSRIPIIGKHFTAKGTAESEVERIGMLQQTLIAINPVIGSLIASKFQSEKEAWKERTELLGHPGGLRGAYKTSEVVKRETETVAERLGLDLDSKKSGETLKKAKSAVKREFRIIELISDTLEKITTMQEMFDGRLKELGFIVGQIQRKNDYTGVTKD